MYECRIWDMGGGFNVAIITYSGRIALAKYIMSLPLHLAIGEGDDKWGDIPEAPDYEATGLIKEIGRKALTRAFFVNKDDDGEIDLPGGRRYSYSEKPTRQIYMNFVFNYGEGISDKIREIGVFADTKFKNGLPKTQTFFTPDQIIDPGILITLEHLETADTFTPNKKGQYGTIFTA